MTGRAKNVRSSTHRAFPPTLVMLILLMIPPFIAGPSTTARAGVFDATWESPVVVDTGAIDISSSGGSAMEHTPNEYGPPWSSLNEWHVFYAKSGEIWHAVRTETGWLAPDVISSSGGTARDPKLAFTDDRMIVVWEDARRGHAEVWSRMFNGTSWTAEACLTDDAVPSRAPAIAGRAYDGAYLVWTEGADGQTQIYGRAWDGAAWQTPANVSSSSAYAVEPTITITAYGYEYVIAWADARNGETEIYMRLWMDGFGTTTRLTNLAGSCRRPCAHAEECCGDVIGMETLIAFENDATGHNETWVVCYGYIGGAAPAMISASDGKASERPIVHSFPFMFGGEMGGVMPKYLITWTDAGAPGAKEHPLGGTWNCPTIEETEVLSSQGLGTSAISTSLYDYASAHAGLLAAWLEERNGQRSLVVQRGSAPSCKDWIYTAPLALLVSPAGIPGNTMSVWNRCGSGSPAEGVELALSVDWVLDGHLTWDAQQTHPNFRPQVTGPDGSTNFAIRGGGCYNGGNASLRVDGVEVRHWYGAKSPDVDGDCAVLADDVAYVQSKVGSTDFCADLDGSGTVTQADLAIVQAALGQLCSQLAGVETDVSPMLRLNVRPNPAPREVVFGLSGMTNGPITAEIFDAAGRLVRAWDDAATLRQGTGFVWDGRDASGIAAPSGVYFVRARAGARCVTRTFLIAR